MEREPARLPSAAEGGRDGVGACRSGSNRESNRGRLVRNREKPVKAISAPCYERPARDSPRYSPTALQVPEWPGGVLAIGAAAGTGIRDGDRGRLAVKACRQIMRPSKHPLGAERGATPGSVPTPFPNESLDERRTPP